MAQQIRVTGMTCAACVRRVEKALAKVEGVESAEVNYATGVARIEAPVVVDRSALVAALEKAGYGAENTAEPAGKESPLWPVLVVSGAISVVSMAQHHRPVWVNVLLALATTWVLFWPGLGIYRAALGALRHRTSTMDTLIALGTLAGWGYSVWAMFRWPNPHEQADHIFFESAAVIIALVLLGRHLESRARTRMVDSMNLLMDLTPPTALVVTGDEEREVPLSAVARGDRLRVKPGMRVPVDGVILQGRSRFDEAMWTGEPLMVSRGEGEALLAGTLNHSGSVEMRADGVGGDTYLARVAAMVAEAQGAKAPIQQLADRVASVFVPIVIGLAFLTFLAWAIALRVPLEAALIPAVAVLVIACPCALGLATPTAIIAGVGWMARKGILVRDGGVFERALGIKSIIFDKTGTLTEGHFEERAVLQLQAGVEWRAAVGSLEQLSEHPIAVAFAPGDLTVDGFENHPGRGVEGLIEGVRWRVGKKDWLAPAAEIPDEWRVSGWTVVAVERDSQPVALVALGDQLLPGLAGALSSERTGFHSLISSGDTVEAVRRVAEQTGADDFRGGVLPHQKQELVREIQAKGAVAMVGDGMNDAAALAGADLGISMGSGTDLAKSASDVTLVRHDPLLAIAFLRDARTVVGTIRANLAWAFGYNLVMIPLAMVGKLNPMWAAAAMALSSLSVVLNSSRLSRKS